MFYGYTGIACIGIKHNIQSMLKPIPDLGTGCKRRTETFQSAAEHPASTSSRILNISEMPPGTMMVTFLGYSFAKHLGASLFGRMKRRGQRVIERFSTVNMVGRV